MSPAMYPSKEDVKSAMSELDVSDRIVIMEYLRGEVGSAESTHFYYFLAGMIVMGLITLVIR